MKQKYLLLCLLTFFCGVIQAQISQSEKLRLEKEVMGNYQRTKMEGAQLYKTKTGYRVLVTVTSASDHSEARLKSQRLATEFILGAESHSVSVYQSDSDGSYSKETFSDKIIQTSLGQVNSMEALTSFPGEQGDMVYSYFLVVSQTNAKKGLAGLMSMVVPGMGQFYKGNTVKGGVFLGLAVAVGTGALVCESTRSSYRNKAIEQPKFTKEYSTKADNWETGRNVCLGTAGAIYLWNVIDAFFAKSAQKAVVKSKDRGFTFSPQATVDHVGFSLAYKF